jgi:hypothetical protein
MNAPSDREDIRRRQAESVDLDRNRRPVPGHCHELDSGVRDNGGVFDLCPRNSRIPRKRLRNANALVAGRMRNPLAGAVTGGAALMVLPFFARKACPSLRVGCGPEQ